MIRAFAYLLLTSGRNRLTGQLRRIRNPRYAIAFVVGALYFWTLFLRRGVTGSAQRSVFLGPTSEALSPLLIVISLAGVWLFGSDLTALAFTQGEVSMLFAAPVSRRGLIGYKLVRAQIGILISSLIWVLILRRGSGALPAYASILALWVLFATIGLHRLGAALVRAATYQFRGIGARRYWVSLLVVASVMVVIIVQVMSATGDVAAESEPFAFVQDIVHALSTTPARIVLYPFRALLAPTFAHSLGAWARAMVPALAVCGLHVVWVLRTDTAFEEAAAAVSEARAKQLEAFRARRTVTPTVRTKGVRRTIRLDSRGRPAIAIAWKNTLLLMRTSLVGLTVTPVMIGIMVAIGAGGRGGHPMRTVGIAALTIAGVLTLIGPRAVRNDLRSDMLHLPLLKTLPLTGAQLVVAEFLPGVMLITGAQILLLTAGTIALRITGDIRAVSPDIRVAALSTAPLVLCCVNAAMFLILNGTAVLFPAWVRLGPAGGGGIEMMGQNLITTFGTLVGLLLLLVLPIATGGGIVFLLAAHEAVAIGVACVVGSVILGAELYALVAVLGRAFERAEPQQVA